MRYKGEDGSDASSSGQGATSPRNAGNAGTAAASGSEEQIRAELAKTEKELANAKDLQQRFAVMYASQPAERDRIAGGKNLFGVFIF